MNGSPRSPRQGVLVLSHSDGYIEAFGDKNIDVHIARVPTAGSPEAERQAEDVAHMMLPLLYRDLHRADRLRATGTTKPLRPSALQASLEVREILQSFKRIADGSQPRREVCAWTL